MDERAAVETLAGLAQEHRLRVFRLLLREGPEGLPAGLIALRLGVPASTMSSHLGQLERAGLLKSRREQRRILYAVDLEGIRHLLAFLIEDCCGGHPELCGYGRGGRLRDDHDLSQPGLRDVSERAGDDPEQRRRAEDHRISEDAAEPR
jgi:DNA-binding transcriptional ArsR family regulator